MLNKRLISKLVWLVMVAVAVPLAGCGGGKTTGKVASVSAGKMPSDGVWEGVYYDVLFGDLHLVEEGSGLRGRWQRPRKGQWGELKGKADGNLMRFTWTEYVDGLVGPNSKRQGKGYFVYVRPPGENVDDVLEGELGHNEDEVGVTWRAIKQRNIKPRIGTIGGLGASEVGGGEWDKGNSEPGEPEEPTEPDDADSDDADSDDADSDDADSDDKMPEL